MPEPSPTPPLYLDPMKLRLWILGGVLFFLLLMLWLFPKYYGWLRREDSRNTVEVERILREGKK
jgi:hypothetical protein